jgi:hypothetical protein
MKVRILLSALLLAAGLAFVSGCGRKCEAKTAEQVRTDTPTEVAQKAIAALKQQDFAAIAELAYGKAQEELMQHAVKFSELKQAAESGDKAKKIQLAQVQKMFERISIEIKGENIDGEYAVIEVVRVLDGRTSVDKMYLKNVNGEWKLVAEEEYTPAK